MTGGLTICPQRSGAEGEISEGEGVRSEAEPALARGCRGRRLCRPAGQGDSWTVGQLVRGNQ